MWATGHVPEKLRPAAFVSFLSPAILNLSKNSERNKTSTHCKAVLEARQEQD